MYLYVKLLSTTVNATITIYNSADDTVVVNAATMTKISSDTFKYYFAVIDNTKDYYYVATDTASGAEAFDYIQSQTSYSALVHNALDTYVNKSLYQADPQIVANKVWTTPLPVGVAANDWTDELGVVWVDENSTSWTSA